MILVTINDYLGTLPGWLTVGTIALLSFTLIRGGHPQAVTILKEDNAVLQHELTKEREENKLLKSENERLKLETSFMPMVETVIAQFSAHEQSAKVRHDALLRVLGLVAERLGPDNGNGTG